MNALVKIENQELQIKEYQGKRVVTFKDIGNVHQINFENAKRSFRNNKHNFNEGVDYFFITRNAFREKLSPKEKLIGNLNISTVLLTETGYLMLVKSLTDDLAWKVQRQLDDCYFKVKEDFSMKFVASENEPVTQKEWMQIFTSITKFPQNERNLVIN